MIKLVDGKGQLGTVLAEKITKLKPKGDWIIYHTWNIDDMGESAQQNEYVKYSEFVSENYTKSIAFISTNDTMKKHYVWAKMSAELLTMTAKKWKIFRLPYMIGKGLCKRIRDGEKYFPGVIEISTLDIMAERIIKGLSLDDGIFNLHGNEIDVGVLAEAIRYGSN